MRDRNRPQAFATIDRSQVMRSLVIAGIVVMAGCDPGDQSTLLYRLPYEHGTDVFVSNDHLTHSPPNRLDLVGTNGDAPYRVVAAQTGIIRIIEEDNTQNCCNGTCNNNYVWIEHIAGEWTKYSHLATDTVSEDAGLAVGDVVIAGTFLGFESNVGRACGTHLHFEVGIPDDVANPLKPGGVGEIDGINLVPRFCNVPGQIVFQGETHAASNCGDDIVTCIQSVESPSTEGNCDPGFGGDVCVQEINNVALTSTYTQGEHFESSSLKIHLDWCPDADCSPTGTIGRAIHVIVTFEDGNADPLVFIANCQNRQIIEVVHGVEEIVIQEAPNLSSENVVCSGNTVPDAFARWEICEVHPSLVE